MASLLCYVTDRRALRDCSLDQVIRAAIAAGVDGVQIREKDLPTRDLLAIARDAVAAARGTATRVLLNDRLDVALAAGAAGVHLGRESLPAAEVVRRLRRGVEDNAVGATRWVARRAEGAETGRPTGSPLPGFLVGVSCHSVGEAQQAERDGADYIFFGPVFATPSKAPFGPPQGVERLMVVCGSVRIPVLAIGGINAENAGKCLRAGAAGVAAIRVFQENADAVVFVARLRGERPRRIAP